MSAQVAADLRAAADVLERDGWTQDQFHARADDQRICHCAEGAIALASGDHANVRIESDGEVDWDLERDDPLPERRREAAEKMLAKHLGIPRYASIPMWNDAPERTAAEVIAALRAAADKADQP